MGFTPSRGLVFNLNLGRLNMDFNRIRSSVIAVAAAILLLVASAFPVASVGVAHAGEPVTQILNVAVLTPCCGNPEPNGRGLAQANTLSKPNVLEVDAFSGSVTIPIPSSNLGTSSVPTGDIRLVLSRAGANYAECFLAPTQEPENNWEEEEQATFLTSIVKVKIWSLTLFRQFAGFCDVDLSTGAIDPGVPAVQSGDVVTAISVVNSVRTPFLQGTFVQQ